MNARKKKKQAKQKLAKALLEDLKAVQPSIVQKASKSKSIKNVKLPKMITNHYNVEIPVDEILKIKQAVEKENTKRKQELKYLQGLKARINGVAQAKRNGDEMKVSDYGDVEAGEATLKFSDFKEINLADRLQNVRYKSDFETLKNISDTYKSLDEKFNGYKESYINAVIDQWGSSGEVTKLLDKLAKTSPREFAERYYSEPSWSVMNIHYYYPDDTDEKLEELLSYWLD